MSPRKRAQTTIVLLILAAGQGQLQLAAADLSPPAPGPTTAAIPGTATTSTPQVVVSWADIENDTYDQRAHFIAGYKQMEAKVDDQVKKLRAKRATMSGTTDTEDWDFAMKEEENARDDLRAIGNELNQATPENWSQERAKAGRAWVRTQDAYDKVKTSTTS
jgi:hypothetical protein